METWERDLVRMAGSVRPAGSAAPAVEAAVVRRRRRRRAGVALGSAVAVAAVLTGTVLVAPGGGSAGPQPALGTPTPSTAPSTTTSTPPSTPPDRTPPDGPRPPRPGTPLHSDLPEGPPYSGPSVEWSSYELPTIDSCDYSEIFRGRPPIVDLDQQRRLAEQVTGLIDDGFRVVAARPSPVGVIAMVEGSLADARQTLPQVGAVTPWFSKLESYYLHLEDLIEPTRRDVAREVASLSAELPGAAGVLGWSDAAAVVVQWRAPVPPEVLALAGPRGDGVVVLVAPTSYGLEELRDLRAPVRDALRAELGPDVFSSVGPCGDASGLQVDIEGTTLEGSAGASVDVARLETELTDLAGVPVTVTIGYTQTTTAVGSAEAVTG